MITRRLKIYFVFGLALVLVALSTTGCASGSASLLAGSSWPGITVFDGAAYLAYSSKVYAFDSETGSVKWSFPENAAGGQTFYAPPAATDDLVVVTDYSDSLFALNPADGKQLWTFKSDSSRFIGGAVIDEDLIYAATVDGTIHALDRKAGSEEWSYKTEGNVWSTPLLADGVLYITALDRHLYALDARTGKLSWKYPDNGGNPPLGAMVSTPTLYEGVLYFGNFNNRLYALSVETQGVLWTYDASNWVWSSPVIDEQNQRLISADLDGHVFALNLVDGSPAWTYEATGAVVGAPLLGELADGSPVVYLTCKGDPNLLVLNTNDGKEAIRPFSLKAEFTTKFLFIDTGIDTRSIPIFASPVAADELLLIGAHEGNDTLYALDREDLQEKWRFNPTQYENQLKEEQGQAPESFFSNPLNMLLLMLMTLLVFSMMGRGRGKK